MARYRKIDVRMRADEKFRALSAPPPNGQDCWIYLLTNRYTTSIPGLYAAFEETLARDLGWPLEGFRKAFAEVSAKGMAKADWTAGLVFIPNAISYDPPQSPNVVKSWGDIWDELPECSLKHEARAELAGFVKTMSEGFRKAFAEACAEACRNPEPEPEPDQENESARERSLSEAWRDAGLPVMVNPSEMARLKSELVAAGHDFDAFCRSFKAVTDHWRANGAPNCGASPTLAIDKATQVELHMRGELKLDARKGAAGARALIAPRPAVEKGGEVNLDE